MRIGDSPHSALGVCGFGILLPLDTMTGHRPTLPDTPFPDDDGSADPAIQKLLIAARSLTSADYLRAVAGLCSGRLLVPVVATRSDTPAADPTPSAGARTSARNGAADRAVARPVAGDKEAEMAVVMVQTGDGRRGLAVFTSLQALTDWNHTARPVPVTLDRAAGSARQAGAEALLIDIDAPHSLVIEGDVLGQLAAGRRLVEVESGQFGWAIPAGDGE